jgi:hypothetical protein
MMRRVTALVLGLLMTLALALPVAAAPETAGATAMVADVMGRAIPGAEVEIYKLGKGLVAVRTADQMGTVRIPGPLSTGSLWQMRVWAEGYRTVETGWQDLTRTPYQFVRLERLSGDLNVKVIDRDGLALEALVTLGGPGGQVAGEWRATGGVVTRQGLLTGEYQLLVAKQGYAAVSRSVTVTGDRAANAVVMMEKARQGVASEVRDSVTGAPVAGARVFWLQHDGTALMEGAPTDRFGRFYMAREQGVSGTYKVQVAAPGYRTATTAAVTLAPGQETDLSQSGPLMLQPAFGAIAGTVYRPNLQVRADAPLVLEASGFGEIARTRADRDGSYRFTGLTADPGVQYRVRMEAEWEVAESAWMTVPAGQTLQVTLQISETGKSSSGAGTLSGTVVTPGGAPVAGATVELLLRNSVRHTLTTDAAGYFEARDLMATFNRFGMAGDPYTLRVSGDGFVTTAEIQVEGRAVWDVHVPDASRTSVKVVLYPALTDAQGRVVDVDGRPVVGAELTLTPEGGAGARTARSDENGWFAFRELPSAPLMRYAMTVKAAGFRTIQNAETVVRPGQLQALPTVRLTPATVTLLGQVLGADGQTVTGARVTVRDAGGQVLGAAETDGQGLYRVQAPATALPVTLDVGRNGWSRALTVVAEAPASGVVSRDLVVLPLSARASGRVLDAAGSPVASMRVELLEDGRGIVAATRTDANGVYRFDEVVLDGPGLFWLRVDTPVATFAGSLRHGTELVPLMRLMPGQEVVTDLLVGGR